MGRGKIRICLCFLCFLVCASVLTRALPKAIQTRKDAKLEATSVSEGVPASVALATTALGGFRGILVDLLWLRCQSMKQEGKFYEMAQLYDWITSLQPHYKHVWAFAGWDMSYNVSVEVDPQDRWFWVRRGLFLIQNKGMRFNTYDPDIPLELSWIYFHKIGKDLDYGHVYYRTMLAQEMQMLFGGSCPREQLEVLVAMPVSEAEFRALPDIQALDVALGKAMNPQMTDPPVFDSVTEYHKLISIAQNGDQKVLAVLEVQEHAEALGKVFHFLLARTLRDEYNVDPARMLAMNKEFGPIDWRTCDAWGLYWALISQENAHTLYGEDTLVMKYERMVYFALDSMVKRGGIRFSSDGMIYEVPDYQFLPKWITYLARIIDDANWKKTEKDMPPNVIGPRSALQYALRDAVIKFYFNGEPEAAREYLALLQKRYVDPKYKAKTIEGFVESQMKDYVDGISKTELLAMIEGYLRQSYINLAVGDLEKHQAAQSEAKMMHDYGKKRFPATEDDPNETGNVGYIPPLYDMSADVLVRLLDGSDPTLTEQARKRLGAMVPPDLLERAHAIYQQKRKMFEEMKNKNQVDLDSKKENEARQTAPVTP